MRKTRVLNLDCTPPHCNTSTIVVCQVWDNLYILLYMYQQLVLAISLPPICFDKLSGQRYGSARVHWPGWRGFETHKTCRERTEVGTAELSWHRLTIATLAHLHLLGRRGLSICTCKSYPTQEDCESFGYRKLKLCTWFAQLSMEGRHRLVKPEGRQNKQTTDGGRVGIYFGTSAFSGHFQFRCFDTTVCLCCDLLHLSQSRPLELLCVSFLSNAPAYETKMQFESVPCKRIYQLMEAEM